MFNKAKVITGIAVFVILASVPLWRKVFSEPIPAPQVSLPEGTHCVEDRAYMRKHHMDLLDQWRNDVVRHNNKDYVNSRGEHFNKSLTKTCLNCHKNKENFCDSCHQSADVKPYCFDCHLTGTEIPAGQKNSMRIYKKENNRESEFIHSLKNLKKGALL